MGRKESDRTERLSIAESAYNKNTDRGVCALCCSLLSVQIALCLKIYCVSERGEFRGRDLCGEALLPSSVV